MLDIIIVIHYVEFLNLSLGNFFNVFLSYIVVVFCVLLGKLDFGVL